MSKPKPPANDHLAAMINLGAEALDHDMTDEELDARLAAVRVAQRRVLKLTMLRMDETALAELNTELARVSGTPSADGED